MRYQNVRWRLWGDHVIKEVLGIYSDKVLNEALMRYRIDRRTVRSLGGNESFVYGYEFQGNEYVTLPQ